MGSAALTLVIGMISVSYLSSIEGAPFTIANGHPTSFFHLEGPHFPHVPALTITHSHSFPFIAPVTITKSEPHRIATSGNDFFSIGHPMTGINGNSLGTGEDDFDAARHAGRVGIELSRLERSNTREYTDYIASGYTKDNFKVPQPFPLPLKHLSLLDVPFDSFLVGGANIHQLQGIHFDDSDVAMSLSLHDLNSYTPDSFPTIFHGPNLLSLQSLGTRRNRVFAFNPNEVFPPDVAIASHGGPQRPEIVKSHPVFESRSILHI